MPDLGVQVEKYPTINLENELLSLGPVRQSQQKAHRIHISQFLALSAHKPLTSMVRGSLGNVTAVCVAKTPILHHMALLTFSENSHEQVLLGHMECKQPGWKSPVLTLLGSLCVPPVPTLPGSAWQG